jgi:hypothetical protein
MSRPIAGKSFEYLKHSTLIWLAVLLFVATILLSTTSPLHFVRYNKLTPQNVAEIALAYKNKQLTSAPAAPDVMILGSSLMMAAVKYCDTKYCPDATWANDALKLKVSDFQGYTHAHYLEKLLSKQLGKPIVVFNFSSAACMISDASLILQRAIEAGKAPKVVLFGIAPRDFVDNLVPDLGRTPAFDTLANWQCLPQVLPSQMANAKLAKDSLRDFVLSAIWPFYKEKSNYRTLLADEASKYFSHPATLAEAEKMEIAELPSAVVNEAGSGSNNVPTGTKSEGSAQLLPSSSASLTGKQQKENTLSLPNDKFGGFASDHIIDYRNRYNPANYQRFAQEAEQFVQLLAICRQKRIELVIVNMPITDVNKSLMPMGMYDRYKNNVQKLTYEYGAKFIDLDQANVFHRQDFLDSVHTNPDGGKKVLDHLFVKLSLNHALDCLTGSRTKIANGTITF